MRTIAGWIAALSICLSSTTTLWAENKEPQTSTTQEKISESHQNSISTLSTTSYAPQIINYQGYLTDRTGSPLNGSIPARVSIWDALEQGNELWAENIQIEIAQGYFTAELGIINPIPYSVFNGQDRWLQLTIGTEVLTPRKHIVSVANAFHASNAAQLDSHPVNEFYLRSQADDNEQNNIDASKLGGIAASSFLSSTQSDEKYVLKNEANSITSKMIVDKSVQLQDIGFDIGQGDITAVNAGTGLAGGGGIGDVELALDADYVSGKAYDTRFVKKEERNSINSDMISDNQVLSEDIKDGSIRQIDMAFDAGDITEIEAGTGLTGGGASGKVKLQLDIPYANGEAYDSRFVKKDQLNAISSGMIIDGQVTSADIKNATIQQEDLAFPAGDITSINAINGISGGGSSGDVSVYLEPTYRAGTAYDSRFVNENQSNSVTSAMILNGTVQPEDVGFPIGDVTGITAGTGLSGGGTSGDVALSLSQPYANGSAYDGVFVNEGQANSISSSMIQDGQVAGNDIASNTLTGSHLQIPLEINRPNTSGALVSVNNPSTNSAARGIYAEGYYALHSKGINTGVYSEGPTALKAKGSNYGVWAESSSGWALWVQGTAHCSNGGWGDLAEHVYGSESLEAGDVVVIDSNSKLAVTKCTQANDTAVAGVVSTKPSLTVGQLVDTGTGYPLALAGIVECKVTTKNGPITAGDLLTTSDVPGYAMKATEPQIGTILGKALESLNSGTGKIHVLITLK